MDNNKVSYTYDSEQKAQQVLDYINEFTEEPKTEEPKYVYVSNNSEEDALQEEKKRILITTLPWQYTQPYLCVLDSHEEKYLKWEKYEYSNWKYAVPVPSDKKKLRELYMTDAEYEKLTTWLK